MAATVSRAHLSGSPLGGKNVKIAATTSPGTLIHTSVAGSTSFDEVYLWAANTDTVTRTLTVEAETGGAAATDPDELLVKTLSLPPNSPRIPILTGESFNNAVVIRGVASAANVIIVGGHVNQIVPA